MFDADLAKWLKKWQIFWKPIFIHFWTALIVTDIKVFFDRYLPNTCELNIQSKKTDKSVFVV
jgi:hypothetical protein